MEGERSLAAGAHQEAGTEGVGMAGACRAQAGKEERAHQEGACPAEAGTAAYQGELVGNLAEGTHREESEASFRERGRAALGKVGQKQEAHLEEAPVGYREAT